MQEEWCSWELRCPKSRPRECPGHFLAYCLSWRRRPHSDFLVALLGSTIITTGLLVLLAALERHGGGLVEGRIGVTYVLAGAITVLFLASERIPEVGVIKLLRGQIIAISNSDMVFLLIFYSFVAFILWYFRR